MATVTGFATDLIPVASQGVWNGYITHDGLFDDAGPLFANPQFFLLGDFDSQFTLVSSDGECGIDSSTQQFTCGKGASSNFSVTAVGSNNVLVYNDQDTFSSTTALSGVYVSPGVDLPIYNGVVGDAAETFLLEVWPGQ